MSAPTFHTSLFEAMAEMQHQANVRVLMLEETLRNVDAFLADPDGANPIDSINFARDVIRKALADSNWCKRP